MKKYILLLFIIHSALFIHAQKKVYVRMIDTSGWGNNFADTASINALSLSLYDRLADTSAAVRSALVDTASAIRGALPALEESQAIIDTASAIRSALPALEESQAIIDTASAIRSTITALPTTNLYTADGTISDPVRNVTLGSNDINFDANTLFIDGSENRVGIGTNNPIAEFEIYQPLLNRNERGLVVFGHQDHAAAPIIKFLKSRGSISSQTTLSSGDQIGLFRSAGYDGTNYIQSAYFGFIVDGTVSTGTLPVAVRIGTGTSDFGTEYMRITSAGLVGIGTTAPSVILDANGQIRARTWSGSNSTTVCRDANGVLVPCTSDARLKRNISPIDSSQALDKVIDLVPVTYRWKSENIRDDIDTVAIQSAKAIIDSLKMIEASDTTGEVRQQIKDQREILRQARKDIKDRRDAVTRYNYGFIAQQVRDVDEILSGETDDGYLTVHNDQITSLLVGAIKAQEARIQQLEEFIKELKIKN